MKKSDKSLFDRGTDFIAEMGGEEAFLKLPKLSEIKTSEIKKISEAELISLAEELLKDLEVTK